MDVSSHLEEKLLQIKAIKLKPRNPFTWASGIKSPIYCDNRIVLSYPDVRDFVKNGLIEKSKEFVSFDIVAGVATAGIPHGMMLADALQKPFVYVRSKPKGHGRQNTIEGYLKGDEKVLVVEDLISTGGSSIKAVNALEQKGCKIVGVLALFSYGFNFAENNFKNKGLTLKVLANYDDLIKIAVSKGYVDENDLKTLKEWRQKFDDNR